MHKHKAHIFSGVLKTIMVLAFLLVSLVVTVQAEDGLAEPVNSYGPIVKNEDLWVIADKLRSDQNVSIPQMAVALFQKNPTAFRAHNINGLLVNSVLKIPTREQVLQLSREQAFNIFQTHWKIWQASQAQGQTGNLPGNSLARESASFPDESILPAHQGTKTALLQTGTTDIKQAEHVAEEEPVFATAVKHLTLQQQIPVTEQNDKVINNSILNAILPGLLPEWLKQPILVENSPVYITLGIVLLFFAMLWYFRNTEDKQDELEIMSLHQQHERQDSPADSKGEGEPEPVNQQSSEIINDSPAAKKLHRNLLEAAYDLQNKDHNSTFDVISTADDREVEARDNIEDLSDYSDKSGVLDSSEEIKNVQNNVRDLKIQAFLKLTGNLTMTDEELAEEFDNIKNNQKVDVFIEEFEQIISSLSSQTPELENQPDDIESLMQFKLSVHFVKVLSEMMQARYLRYFSDTVIDYLEEVLNGQIVRSEDISKRLLVVVSFYRQYVHSIKDKYKHQISA